MTNKKRGTTQEKGGADATQDKLNELYTAHQVHTLAQLLFRQLAARANSVGPWTPSAGANPQRQASGGPIPQTWAGARQGGPQPLIYWYP
jgi:hypothetical protein